MRNVPVDVVAPAIAIKIARGKETVRVPRVSTRRAETMTEKDRKADEHEGQARAKEKNEPETQNLPTISELFVRAAPRLGVLSRDSSYAHNRQTGAPDKDEREGKDESDFRGDVFLR